MDIRQIIEALGTKATAAATGAVSNAKYFMAYIKQIVTELQVVDTVVDAILVDTGTTVPAQITALVTDYLGHATHGLAQLETLVDSLETWLGDPSGGTLTTITARIGNIARSLDLIIGARWDAAGDLGTDIAQLLTYTDILDNATNGLANIKSLIDTLDGVADAILVDTGTTLPATLVTIDTVVDGIQTDLSNATDGLGALKALIDAVQATVNTIEGYTDLIDDATNGLAAIKAEVEGLAGAAMRGTDNAALASAWTAALATALGNYTAARAGYLDNLSAGAVALEATLTAIKGGGWTNETLKAIKDAIDALTSVPLSTDWKGSFNWDTSAYTTVEQDISALFSTNLALTTRRKYVVKLDLTAVAADGSFTELYLAVKEKIDGTNYRAIDRKTATAADLAATAEPGIIIEIPATSENVQITMQMAVALAGDATIYYAVVKEHLE